MTSQFMHSARQHGFTLIEVIVVVAVLALLAGLALPMLGSPTRDDRVTEVLTGISWYGKACKRYHADTGSYAVEVSDAQGARRHQLSMPQDGTTSWRGPYIDHVLSTRDNPFEGSVVIHDDLDDVTRFDLDGDGTAEIHGKANVVVFTNVDEASAKKVDEALDQGVGGGEWQSTGRVEWRGNKTLMVLLYQD